MAVPPHTSGVVVSVWGVITLTFHQTVDWWSDFECPWCEETFEMHWHAQSLDSWTMCPNCGRVITRVIELQEDDERV